MQHIRRIATVLGVLGLLAGTAGVVAHYFGLVSTTATRIASFTPLLVAVGVIAVPLLAIARRRILTLLAVMVAAAGVWTQVPLFTRAGETPVTAESVSVRLMQANIRLGEADPAALVQTVTEQHVDVLTVIELTPDAVERLHAAGMEKVLPYSFVRPRTGGGGAGIYSRFQLGDGVQLPDFILNNVQAVVDIPKLGPVVVYALHPLPPYPAPSYQWNYELRRLRGIFADQRQPLIVGADFNSTYDHRQYRDMLRNAAVDGAGPLLDADTYTGAGLVATYPADRWFPSFLAIDKILTRGGTPESFRRVDLPGSDHHGVIGDIRFDIAS